MKPLILLCAAMLFATGCQSKSQEMTVERVNENPFGIAQWEYTNRDEAVAPVTTGLLTLPSPLPAGRGFYGSWQAKYVGKSGEEKTVGPQITGGKLHGELAAKGQLILHLNPGMADNNVTLQGTVAPDTISGTWEYSTFSGKTASGAFEAKRVQ